MWTLEFEIIPLEIPVISVFKNELFFGEKNNGAYINNHRIRVSKKNKLDECLFASGKIGIDVKNLPLEELEVKRPGWCQCGSFLTGGR